LEQKKEDLELIRAENTKIEDKNMFLKSEAWHGPCHQPHGRANPQDLLLLLLLQGQATY